MNHRCNCHSAVRPLALLFGGLADGHEAVAQMVERFAMEWRAEFSVAVVYVGPGQAFGGAAEVTELIYGVLGSGQAPQVRATWLEPGPIEAQMGALLRAPSLASFAPARDSPLAGILDARRIQTWFQPIVERDRSVWGYECLMRAFDEVGEVISPARLIQWARQENLLFMLDRVCRESHIANAAAARFPGEPRFLINFLPSVIYKPEFCLQTTVKALGGTDLAPHRIIFEVVETEQVNDHEHLREILAYYREAGFEVALDDVAAGYSGLTMMAELDPDLIKMDRQLVARAPISSGYAEVCQSIVDLSQRRGKPVLAEGVETRDQFEFMRDMGVQLFQGYFFGRPAPAP